MAVKRLHFRTEAGARILQGASTLADVVTVTLGPKARCILFEKRYGQPLASDDGLTIATKVELEDPEENLGVQMLAAEQTGDRVDDGTITSALFAYELYAGGVRNVVRQSGRLVRTRCEQERQGR